MLASANAISRTRSPAFRNGLGHLTVWNLAVLTLAGHNSCRFDSQVTYSDGPATVNVQAWDCNESSCAVNNSQIHPLAQQGIWIVRQHAQLLDWHARLPSLRVGPDSEEALGLGQVAAVVVASLDPRRVAGLEYRNRMGSVIPRVTGADGDKASRSVSLYVH